ncbi:hypothetical protein HQ305_00315 [Rhodococcus sp. BP-149]|uniref:hypothetical protein n=1 Tax=unclassified Rhodococcus (in: high G+C Gram-positive bacteria) TaxID=192944 RepID=UPI001C9B7E53|nr:MULTISPECIES: hypothetical protein [unclassified Rhodococcus (in: high G+C Gram-positive bacteria)]MBY6685139.1 hypothetical protein [Rhodococcus sp. BP-288]MBY6692377.1 hypothetical protein [Rhodococcus sp. BP-188]MBY6698275.1 hypothetical protein [Rhodococcus sp. BP-285]MBY6711955.1 hypothetical protein [Rhodococcus sp. BP-160]MBY6722484.1 hypothetical protein [Rhodococcus sp. BP-149]
MRLSPQPARKPKSCDERANFDGAGALLARSPAETVCKHSARPHDDRDLPVGQVEDHLVEKVECRCLLQSENGCDTHRGCSAIVVDIDPADRGTPADSPAYLVTVSRQRAIHCTQGERERRIALPEKSDFVTTSVRDGGVDYRPYCLDPVLAQIPYTAVPAQSADLESRQRICRTE